MPPILLLKNDKNFYGELKPKGTADPQKLERPPPPPNPMSNVKLSNEFQRDNAVERITRDINTPENLGSSEEPTIQAELNKKDILKLQNEDDLYSKFVKFIDDPMGVNEDKSVIPDTEMRLKDREIVGGTNFDGLRQVRNDLIDKPLEAAEDTVKEISQNVSKYVNDKLFMAVLLVGGIYLAGQFLQGAGKSLGKSKKLED